MKTGKRLTIFLAVILVLAGIIPVNAASHKPSQYFRADAGITGPTDKPAGNLRLQDENLMSGSAQFSAAQLHALAETLRERAEGKEIFVVDLRQESHVFLNGVPVSWYGDNNQLNRGMGLSEVQADEQNRFGALVGKTIDLYGGRTKGNKTPSLTVQYVETEEALVTREGFGYFRIPVTDHTFPEPDQVDAFIDFVKQHDPERTWLHFHCQAGKGRPGIYMMLYDKMRHLGDRMEDIIARQVRDGGSNPLKSEGTKSELTPLLFRYVEENSGSGYIVRWKEWLEKQPVSE